MKSISIPLAQHIKPKWFHIVVEGLMIKEKFCQKTQILAVDAGQIPIHFKHRQIILPVDFIGWRTEQRTFAGVPQEDLFTLHVLEAELTNEQFGESGVLMGIW